MKLIAEQDNDKIHIRVFEDSEGVAYIERLRPNKLRWHMQPNPSLGRPMSALEFATMNRIPLVDAR